MSMTQLGVATVTGIDGTFTGGGLPTNAYIVKSVNFVDNASKRAVKSQLGETVGLRIWDKIGRATLTYYPAYSTIAGAKGSVDLPAVGTAITFTGFPGPGTNFALNGTTWIYTDGGTIGQDNEGDTVVTINIEKYGAAMAVAT